MKSAKRIAKLILPSLVRRKARECAVFVGVKRVHGPNTVDLANDEAAVTCVVRNGEYYIKAFIEHYTKMGFRHIFLLDNGSSDGTVAIARSSPNVTIFRSNLPVEAHQGLFKKHLARRCVRRGWCLDVDIDEFFDYPFSDRIQLRDLLRYLNKKGYTAVLAQMLDMFSDQSLAALPKVEDISLKENYCCYDISAVRKERYAESQFARNHGANNKVSDDRTELYFGGIRQTLIGHECLLTKHSLFVPSKVPTLFGQVHFVNGACLADLSCVLLHYKFTANAIEIAEQNRINFPGNERLYKDTIKLLTKTLEGIVESTGSCKLQSTNELLLKRFMFVSQDYLEQCVDVDKKHCGTIDHSYLKV